MCITLTLGVNAIDKHKPVFRKKLTRFINQTPNSDHFEKLLAFYKSRLMNIYDIDNRCQCYKCL